MIHTGSLLSPITLRCIAGGIDSFHRSPNYKSLVGHTIEKAFCVHKASSACNHLLPTRSVRKCAETPFKEKVQNLFQKFQFTRVCAIQLSFMRSVPACAQTANTDGSWLQVHLYNQRQQVLCGSAKGMFHFPKFVLPHRNTPFPHIRENLLIYPVC